MGRPGRVAEMTWDQLRDLNLVDGGQISRLRDMLEAFPETRFNIDLKDAGSAAEVTQVLVAAGAVERVRLASFSERRLRIVDRKLVAAARRAGVEVHVWTIDDKRSMRELIALGVNGIVTNRTDLLVGVLAS